MRTSSTVAVLIIAAITSSEAKWHRQGKMQTRANGVAIANSVSAGNRPARSDHLRHSERQGAARRVVIHERVEEQVQLERREITATPDASQAVFWGPVQVGGKRYNLGINPYVPFTALQPDSGYKGGKDTGKSATRGDTQMNIFIDQVSVDGFAADTPIGLTKDWLFQDTPIKGYLSLATDDAEGALAEEDQSLKGFATQVAAQGKYMTLSVSVAHGQSGTSGSFSIGNEEPSAWESSTLKDHWGFESGTLNGHEVKEVWLTPGTPFIMAPEDVVKVIFDEAKLKTIKVKDEVSGQEVLRAASDCSTGIDLELKLGGTTISVGGLATIIPTVNNKCFHLLQSSPKGFNNWGWPVYRAAKVTFDPKGKRIGFTASGGKIGGAAAVEEQADDNGDEA